MKKFAVAASVFVLAATSAAGQRLETVRTLVDTLGGVGYVTSIVYDSTNNEVYVGGANIVVIDGQTNAKTARIEVPAGKLGYNPTSRRLYAASADSLRIIDLDTKSVVASLPYGDDSQAEPAFVHNTRDNQVYFIPDHRSGDRLIVLDGAGDSVLTEIHAGDYPFALAYNPLRNKVYCANLGNGILMVIDGASDTVLKEVTFPESGSGFRPIVYNPRRDAIYCGFASLPGMAVIDCATDSIVDLVDIYLPWYLTYHAGQDKVYCLEEMSDYVSVIDCSTNSVVKEIHVPDPHADIWGLWLNPAANRLYGAAVENHIAVIDCESDSAVSWLSGNFTDWVTPMGYNSEDSKVYVGTARGSVHVLDGDSDSTFTTVLTSRYSEVTDIAYDSASGQVYCLHERTGALTPIDAQYTRVGRTRPVGARPEHLLAADFGVYFADPYAGGIAVVGADDTIVGRVIHTRTLAGPLVAAPDLRKFYCTAKSIAGSTAVAAIDVDGDSVVGFVEFVHDVWPMVYNPASHEVCAQFDARLWFIDGRTHSIVDSLELPDHFYVRQMAVSRTQNRLYCFDRTGRLAVVDGRAHGLLREVAVPPPGSPVVWNPTLDRLYYQTDGSLLVGYDCARDSIAFFAVTGEATGHLVCDTLQNWVYSGCDSAVWVVDGESGRIVDAVETGAGPAGPMTWCPDYNRVFFSSSDSTVSVIVYDVGIADGQAVHSASEFSPTVVRSTSPLRVRRPAALLDITGRRVAELTPGENDIRHLAPGVYFICPRQSTIGNRQSEMVTKIVIQR